MYLSDADSYHAQKSSTNADGTAAGQKQRLFPVFKEVNAAALRFYCGRMGAIECKESIPRCLYPVLSSSGIFIPLYYE